MLTMEQPTRLNQNPSTRKVVWSKTTTTSTRYINGRPTKTTTRVVEDDTPENRNKAEEGQTSEADQAPAKPQSPSLVPTETDNSNNNRAREPKGRRRVGGFLRSLSFRRGKRASSQEPPEDKEELDEQTSLVSLSGDSSIEEEEFQATGSAQCRRKKLTKAASTTSIQNLNGRKVTTTRLVEDATPEEIEMARKKQQGPSCRRMMLSKTRSTAIVQNLNGRKVTTTRVVEDATPEEIEMAQKKQQQSPCRRMMLSQTRSITSIQNLNGRKVTTTRVVEDATPEEIEMAKSEERPSGAGRESNAEDPTQGMGNNSTLSYLPTRLTSNSASPQSAGVPPYLPTRLTSNNVSPQSSGVPHETKVPLSSSESTVPVRDTKKHVRFGANEILEYVAEQEEESDYEYVEVSESESEYEYEEVSEELLPCDNSRTENVQNVDCQKVTATKAVEDATPEEITMTRTKQECHEDQSKTLQGPCRRSTYKATCTTKAAVPPMSWRDPFLPPNTSGASREASVSAGPMGRAGRLSATQIPSSRPAVGPTVTSGSSSVTQVIAASPIIGPTVKPKSPSVTPSTANPATDAVPSSTDKKKPIGTPNKRRSSKKKSKGLDLTCPIMTMNKPGNEKVWTNVPSAKVKRAAKWDPRKPHIMSEDLPMHLRMATEEDNITPAAKTSTSANAMRKQTRIQSPTQRPKLPSNKPRSRGVCAR